MPMKKILLFLAFTASLVGCVHPRDAFRRSAQADAAGEYEGEPSYSFGTKKPADDIHDMLAEGYVLVGTIGPDSASYSNAKILEFMREAKLERGRGYELSDNASAGEGTFAPGMMSSSSAAGFAQPLDIRSAPMPLNTTQRATAGRRTVKSMYAFFNKSREKPRFGAVLRSLSEEDVKAVGTRDAVKVFVVVKGTPAWAAGLRDGDVVVAVNGKPFSDPKEAMKEVDGAKGTVKVKIRRGAVTVEKDVVLKEKEAK